MTRISDPTQIDHPDLREFAVMANGVAKLEDAVGVREEFVVDLVDEEQRSDLEPWEDDPLEVAWSVMYANFEAADQEVEARVTEWLAQDPEPWPIVRLGVRDPWPEHPGAGARVSRGGCEVSGRTPRSRTSSRIPMGGSAWSTPGRIFPRYSQAGEMCHHVIWL
jgi:hypothetical protein